MAGTAVAVKVWHFLSDWRDDGDDDDAYAARMARRAAAEHARIRTLAGCKHWLQLAADVAAEKEARIGEAAYPAIFLEHFPGKASGPTRAAPDRRARQPSRPSRGAPPLIFALSSCRLGRT